MKQEYVKNWSEMASVMHKPIQAIMELNVRTLQSLSYLKPEEMSQLRQPTDLMDKHVNLMIDNSHKVLEYMRQSFQIIEQSVLSLSKDMKGNSEEMLKKAGVAMSEKIADMPAIYKKALSDTRLAEPSRKSAVRKSTKASSKRKSALSESKMAAAKKPKMTLRSTEKKAASKTRVTKSAAKRAASATRVTKPAAKRATSATRVTKPEVKRAASVTKSSRPATHETKTVSHAAKMAIPESRMTIPVSKLPHTESKMDMHTGKMTISPTHSDKKSPSPKTN